MRKNKFIIYLLLFLLLAFSGTAVFPNTLDQLFSAKPQDAPLEWKGLIGDYECFNIHNGSNSIVIIFEKDKNLYILAEKKCRLLKKAGKDRFEEIPNKNEDFEARVFLQFKRNKNGLAEEFYNYDIQFKRVFYGTESGKQFKIKLVKPVDELRPQALRASPPKEAGNFLKPDLVEVTKLDSTVKLDIRYATLNNFMGAPFYTQAKAFMQRNAAEALARVNKNLKKYGYSLMIYDAYRPWYVTKMFWDATPKDKKKYVADPQKGSRHNRGCAVDITLYDLETGKPVDMTSGFDEFSGRANPGYPGGTSLERWNRWFLKTAMVQEGFTVYPNEWWHFDYKDYQKYPIMNVKFEEIKQGIGNRE